MSFEFPSDQRSPSPESSVMIQSAESRQESLDPGHVKATGRHFSSSVWNSMNQVHADGSVLGDAQRITVGVLEPGYAATPW
jgi:hypothetical protein